MTLRDDDPRSNLPSSITFALADQGTRTLSVTFGTVGLRTVTASGNGFSARGTTTVLPGAPSQIRIAPRGVATTGTPLGVEITVTDRYGQLAADPDDSYLGTVTFDIVGTQPEVAPTLPGPTTFVAADRSAKTVDTVWFRVGTYTLRATGTNLTNATATADVTVVGTAAASLELSLPASARAGQSVPMTVTVRDAGGGIATGFVGTIMIEVDEVGTQLPAFIELDHQHGGTRTVNVVFGKAGLRTVVARHGDLSARAAITISPAAPHRITLLGPQVGTTGEGLVMRVAILDAFGNVANDPALSYTGTVTFTATGPSPLPPFYVPRLPPSIPEPKTFTAGDGSNFVFSTAWFHPGRWTLRASGTNLATPTASLGLEISVGPATRFDILAPATFPAGSNPQAWVRATDAWRNTDPSFNGPAFISGFEDAPESVTLVAGEATETFPLTMTIAGPYTIVAQDGTLYGELTVQVTHANPYRLLATGPDEVVEDTNATITVTVADEYFNTVVDYEGSIDVDVSSFTDYSPPELDFDFVAADQGERDVTILFFSPGPRTLTFDGSPGITPEGVTTHDLLVLSNLPPVFLEISKPAEGPLWVNVPYADGFHVGVFDDNGNPTATTQDMTVTVALDEQYPGPTTLGGTLARLIPQGRHGALFDDLLFSIDGNYTLSATPSIDFPDDVSDPFDVFYRAPEVSIDGIAKQGELGCVTIDYTVSQADGAPITIRVKRRLAGFEQTQWHAASQAPSSVDIMGHFELPEGSHSFLWNASEDLDHNETLNLVEVEIAARAGWRSVLNPEGTAATTIELAFVEGEVCQHEVSALFAAPPGPDLLDPSERMWSPYGALAAADLNGDGKPDLLRSRADGRVGVSFGRGDGGFSLDEVPLGFDVPGTKIGRIVTADFNADGALDVAFAREDGRVEVWVRDTSTSGFAFTPFSVLTSAAPSPIATRDMDGNGLWDLVYVDHNDRILVMYQTESGFEELEVATMADPDDRVPELTIVNADGRQGLDLVYYQMRAVDNDGPDFAHELCLVRSVGDREYEDWGCVDVLEQTNADHNAEQRSGRLVRDLAAQPTLGPNPLITYRVGPLYGSTFFQQREVIGDDGALGFPSDWDRCWGDRPGPSTWGLFEDGEVHTFDRRFDLALQCYPWQGSSEWLRIVLESEDGWWDDEIYDVGYDSNSTIVAADFDGDGTDDLANVGGVLKVIPRDFFGWPFDVDGRKPLRTFSGAFAEENATVALDIDGDDFPDVISALIDGNDNETWLYVSRSSPYSFTFGSSLEVPLCWINGNSCPLPDEWRVFLAAGQLDDDPDEELVILIGGLATSARVLVYGFDDGEWDQLLDEVIQGFHAATLAVGDLIGDGDGLDEIVIGGTTSDGPSMVVAIDPGGNCDGPCFHTNVASAALPMSFRESFIGDFDPDNPGNELVMIETAAPYNAYTLTWNCANPDECIAQLHAPVPVITDSSELVIDGIAAGALHGGDRQGLVVSARIALGGGGTLQTLDHVTLEGGVPDYETLILRSYAQPMCAPDERFDCVEPTLGPLVGTVDDGDDTLDGIDDVLIGWSRGRVWEAVTDWFGRYLFGATVNERGSNALLTDIDDNGLLDVLLHEEGHSPDLWILGQDIRPPPSIIRGPIDFLD